MKKQVLASTITMTLLFAAVTGCRPKDYEFLQTPRAGMNAGCQWQSDIGPLELKPRPGVEVSEKVKGVEWFKNETREGASLKLLGALKGVFSAGLDIEASKIASVQAEDFTHQQVVNPGKLPRGYSYLWETIEASKVKIELDSSLDSMLEGKIDKFAASTLGQQANLQFKAVPGATKGTYEVTGKNLVVAVKVVEFEVETASETVTVKLGKDSQGTDQPGPFGYMVSIKTDGVNLPERKFEVILRNQTLADLDTGTVKRTLSSETTRIHAGPVIGKKDWCVLDNAYASDWDTEGLTCQVTFLRTLWKLEQVWCGLKTVK